MKPLALVLGWTAAAVLALGLFLGFRPLTDAGDNKCGSAFNESPYLAGRVTSCDKERSDALPLPLVMLTLGVVAGVGAVVIGRSEPGAPEAGPQTS